MSDQKETKETKAINVRVPVEILTLIEELAKRERRSLSAQVIVILEQAANDYAQSIS